MEDILKVKELKVIRGKRKILDVPELSIHKGEVVVIIGPNGAGKSTLLQTLAFILQPSSGHVCFYDRTRKTENELLNIRRRMAMVFQEPLLLNASVFDNVAIGLRLRGLSRDNVETKVNNWLDKFGIKHLAGRRTGNLSGGEAQRVSLARAFVTEPEVLFLDEPFTSLDAPTRVTLIEQLEKIINDTGVTTVFVTHDVTGIPYYTDRALLLEEGCIQKEGKLHELLNNQTTPYLQAFFAVPLGKLKIDQ